MRDIHTHTLCHIYIYMYTYTFTFIYIYTQCMCIYIHICKFVYTSFNPQHAAPGKLHEAIVFSFSHILPESRLRHTHRIYSRHLEHFLSQEQQQQWAEEKMQLQKDRKWSHWKTLQLPVLFVRTCGFNRKQLQVLTSKTEDLMWGIFWETLYASWQCHSVGLRLALRFLGNINPGEISVTPWLIVEDPHYGDNS